MVTSVYLLVFLCAGTTPIAWLLTEIPVGARGARPLPLLHQHASSLSSSVCVHTSEGDSGPRDVKKPILAEGGAGGL